MIEYHPRKANVIVDALRRKARSSAIMDGTSHLGKMLYLRKMNVEMEVMDNGGLVAMMKVKPILVDRIKEAQDRDI